MRAAVLEFYGGLPTPLEVDAPDGEVGETLIGVQLAALNPVDLRIASGNFYGATPDVPYVVGSEGAGIVLSSSSIDKGTRVRFSGARPGAVAEIVSVPDGSVVPIPQGVSTEMAAGVGVAGLAAWMSLKAKAKLCRGETVLVLGATGAVGTLAVQMARILGAGRIVAAGRDPAALESLGADATAVLSGDVENMSEAISDAVLGRLEVVIDPLWGDPMLAAAKVASPRARIVNLGESAGKEATLTSALVRSKELVVMGHTNLAASPMEQSVALGEIFSHAAGGRLSLPSTVLALDHVADAWERQRSNPRSKLLIHLAG